MAAVMAIEGLASELLTLIVIKLSPYDNWCLSDNDNWCLPPDCRLSPLHNLTDRSYDVGRFLANWVLGATLQKTLQERHIPVD